MSVWTFIVVCSLITYFWRAAGALAAGRVSSESSAFRLTACITYGVVAALILRMILYPHGVVAEIPLNFRLLAVGVGLAVYFICRRNVAAGAWAAVLVLILLEV